MVSRKAHNLKALVRFQAPQQVEKATMWHVYILRCEDESLYTGITTDLNRRLAEHKNGKGGNYTRSHKVHEKVYSESLETRSRALKRECEIKGWTKAQKERLILGQVV